MLPDDWLEQLKTVYPKRLGDNGWTELKRLVPRAIANGAQFDRMLKGASNYAVHCQRQGLIGTPLIKQAQTYFGRGEFWEEWADQDMRSPAEKAADRAKQALMMRAAKAGFRAQVSGEPDYRYEEALKEAERALQPRAEPKFAVVR